MKKFILQQISMTLHLEDDFEDIVQLCKDKYLSGSLTSNGSMKSMSLQSTRKLALSPMSSLSECNFTLIWKIQLWEHFSLIWMQK